MSECRAQTLQLVTGLPTAPLGVTHDVIGRLQHDAHELGRLEGVVGELGVVAEGRMVTLRKVTDNRADVKKGKVCRIRRNSSQFVHDRLSVWPGPKRMTGVGVSPTLSCGNTLSIFCQVTYRTPRSRAKSR